MKIEDKLYNLEKLFTISTGEMKKITRDFRAEMKKGLTGKASSLKMIPAYIDIPTGNEKGKFLALDLGGTNFRILEIELRGRRKSSSVRVMKFALKKKNITGTAERFFDFLAGCVKIILKKENIGPYEERDLGFTFSFPVRQTGIASGSLVCWTKGFRIKETVGKDVVKLLDEALRKKGINNVRITALANDTVGTLVAKSYEDQNCDIGVIVGTGTNACYSEKLREIKKLKHYSTPSGRMIVNIEWGNFNRLRKTRYDRELDTITDNPGRQILEKMVSGMYLGEIVRLVLKDFFGKKIFNYRGIFKTEYISEAVKDESPNLFRIGEVLKKIGTHKSSAIDRKIVKRVCAVTSKRAARICAAALAGVITKTDPALLRKHTVAIDGSVYEKHPDFSKRMKSALRKIFGRQAGLIKVVLAKDGSGKGAAIIAAIARSFLLQ